MKKLAALLSALLLTAGLQAVFAAEVNPTNTKDESKITAAAAVPMSSGEIKKIDKDAGKITIKHGPLANLAMPAMTMVFRVQDATMLDRVKVGDNVRFIAEKTNGALTVTQIELTK